MYVFHVFLSLLTISRARHPSPTLIPDLLRLNTCIRVVLPVTRARHKDMIKPIKPPERTFGFGGLIMNKEFKSKCLFFLMVGFKVLLSWVPTITTFLTGITCWYWTHGSWEPVTLSTCVSSTTSNMVKLQVFSPPLAVTYVVIEIVIVLGWAARGQPNRNREQSLFLVFHDKDVG